MVETKITKLWVIKCLRDMGLQLENTVGSLENYMFKVGPELIDLAPKEVDGIPVVYDPFIYSDMAYLMKIEDE